MRSIQARTDEDFYSIPRFKLSKGQLSRVDASGASVAWFIGNTNVGASPEAEAPSVGPWTTLSTSSSEAAAYCAVVSR
jgi:hypothetical protein